ncbi:sensor histidine kinase [Actinomyces viscosus]|uniref:sensor histidine kinase n=1 Tax=Actinomyces viscosus TaxID=1656 RepID=UPI0028EAB738|nr:sensor histidine kinase [Actinomyces viscosus]
MTAMPSIASPTERQPLRWYRRRRRWIGIISWELLHAALWIPTFLLLIPMTLLFHLTVPLAAALERVVARALGVDAPSGRKEGERKTPWLLARVAHVEFWRQDLPLCLGGLALSTASFFLGGFFVLLTGTGFLAPFMASAEEPIVFHLGDPEVRMTGPGTAWPLVPLGLVGLALTAGVLLGFGMLRLLLAEALSGERQAQHIKQLTAEVGHLTASRATLMDAFEAERTRIERDLHDGAQQDLVALAMSLGGLRLAAQSLPEDEDTAASRTALLEGIDAAQDRAEAALRDLRETVRGIRPAVLSERGLAPALRDLAGRAPLPISVVVEAEEADLARISQPVATVVYFAVAEAITNAAKHARAGRAAVALRCTGTGLSAVVTDDGRGGADPERENATGLRGMAQRVESIGGHLEVSSPDGGGTRLTITAPLTPPWGGEGREDEQAGEPQDSAAQTQELSPASEV